MIFECGLIEILINTKFKNIERKKKGKETVSFFYLSLFFKKAEQKKTTETEIEKKKRVLSTKQAMIKLTTEEILTKIKSGVTELDLKGSFSLFLLFFFFISNLISNISKETKSDLMLLEQSEEL